MRMYVLGDLSQGAGNADDNGNNGLSRWTE
jgi:hypothetical protein